MGVRWLNAREVAGAAPLVALAVLAFLVFGVVLCGSTPARAASAWLAPVDLTAPDGNADSPAVAMSPTGDAAVAWVDGVVEARVRSAGGEFGPAVPLSSPGSGIGAPQVAMSASGETLVAWGRSDGAAGVWVALRPAGGSFAGPVNISGQGAVEGVSLAMDRRGDAVVVWTATEGPQGAPWASGVVRAAIRPAGGDFGSPVTVDAHSPWGTEPQVAIDDAGGAAVVWPGDTGVWAALRPPGGTFSSPIPLAADGLQPALAMNGAGAAVIAWHVGATVRLVTRAPNGSFGPPMDVKGSVFNNGLAAAMSETGQTRLVWTDDTELQGASSPLGGPPSAASVLFSSNSDDLSTPGIATARDGTTIAVTSGLTTPEPVIGRAWALVWQPGQTAPVAKAVCENPASNLGVSSTRLALDDTGDGIVVCGIFTGSQQLRYAAYDASGPQLRSLAVPESATAGRPLTVSVAPVDVWSGVAHVIWEFGDGHQVVGSSADNTYADPGRYTVRVTAIDRFGNQTSASREIRVAPVPTRTGPHLTVACRRARRSLDSARARYRRALAAFRHRRTRHRLAVVHRIQREAAAARRAVRNRCH